MKSCTEREQVKTVAQRWRNASRYIRASANRQAIQQALDALDVETATAADVAAIIGNNSWVAPSECHECGAETWNAVECGQEPDYESCTATLCENCLRAALKLLEDE